MKFNIFILIILLISSTCIYAAVGLYLPEKINITVKNLNSNIDDIHLNIIHHYLDDYNQKEEIVSTESIPISRIKNNTLKLSYSDFSNFADIYYDCNLLLVFTENSGITKEIDLGQVVVSCIDEGNPAIGNPRLDIVVDYSSSKVNRTESGLHTKKELDIMKLLTFLIIVLSLDFYISKKKKVKNS